MDRTAGARARVAGLNWCPVCGERFNHRDLVIHGHPGITVSNAREDLYDTDGRLVFSYQGMMEQLRQMGFVTSNTGPYHGMTALAALDAALGPPDA